MLTAWKIKEIKQLVYAIKNTTIVYDISILLWQYVSVYRRPSSGQRTYVKGAISAYYVLWDPIFLTRCKRKQLRIYIFVKVKIGCSISKNKYEYY
jgi:hypothetical protein